MKTTTYDHLNRQWYGGTRVMGFIQLLAEQTGKGPNDFLFIEPYSIGDCIHSLGLLPAFRRAYCSEGQRLIFLCETRASALIELMPFADHFVTSEQIGLHLHFEYVASLANFVTPLIPIICPPDLHAGGRLVRAKSGYLHAKRAIMGLRDDDAFSPPKAPPELTARARAKMAEQGVVEGRSIIFTPHARSMRDLGPEFWSAIARRLTEVLPGVELFCDVTTDAPLIPGMKPVNFTFGEALPAVEFAGAAVVLRSGMSDLLAHADAKIFSVIPPVDHYLAMPKAIAPEEVFLSTIFGDVGAVDFKVEAVSHDAAMLIAERIVRDLAPTFGSA